MIKLTPYMIMALVASLAIVGIQQWRIKSKSKEITRLEVRIESIKAANASAVETIRRLQAVNEQCVLDNLSNSKLNKVLAQEHQARVVTLNRELNHAKKQIKALGENHCANQPVGDAVGLLPRR